VLEAGDEQHTERRRAGRGEGRELLALDALGGAALRPSRGVA